MGRDDRQDVNKLRKAGSDLPARDKGIVDKLTDKTREIIKPRPKGYTGQHRDKGGK